jgi:hypothetical protein
MKIFLVGHSVVDMIIHKDGSRQDELKPGGLWHSVNGILPLLSQDDSLFTVTMVSDESMKVYGRNYETVSQEYFFRQSQVPQVTLTLLNNRERLEEYTNLQEKLPIGSVPFEGADGIFINMITGFDISAEDLGGIRNRTGAVLYLDIHSLARGVAEGYSRPLTKIKNPEQWLKNLDVVQCNEAESRMIFDETNEQSLAGRVLACGPEVFIITKGSRGARAYYRQRGETASVFISGIPVSVTTEVGCGDVFGSAFFYYYCKTKDVTRSLKKAVSHSAKFVETGFGL